MGWAGGPGDLVLPTHPRYRITTEKPAGAIAGTQRRENGPLAFGQKVSFPLEASFLGEKIKTEGRG